MKNYYLQSNKNITESINKGDTVVFIDYNKANLYAKKKHSYMFPIWITDNKNKSVKNKIFYGYGIPK